MINKHPYIHPDHIKKVKEQFKEHDFSEEFLTKLLRHPFYFLALQIENKNVVATRFQGIGRFSLKAKERKEMSLMGTIRAMYDGAKNFVLHEDDVEAMALERENICKGCPLYLELEEVIGVGSKVCSAQKTMTVVQNGREVVVTGCGCDLVLKHRSPKSVCPHGKWKARMIEEVEELDNKEEKRDSLDY